MRTYFNNPMLQHGGKMKPYNLAVSTAFQRIENKKLITNKK